MSRVIGYNKISKARKKNKHVHEHYIHGGLGKNKQHAIRNSNKVRVAGYPSDKLLNTRGKAQHEVCTTLHIFIDSRQDTWYQDTPTIFLTKLPPDVTNSQ